LTDLLRMNITVKIYSVSAIHGRHRLQKGNFTRRL
jgi:hypothetical protein